MTVRYTEKDLLLVKRKALQCGLSEADYIRKVTTSQIIKPRLTEDEILFFRHLTGLSNNLNQIARNLNVGENQEMELNEILRLIKSEIKKLS